MARRPLARFLRLQGAGTGKGSGPKHNERNTRKGAKVVPRIEYIMVEPGDIIWVEDVTEADLDHGWQDESQDTILWQAPQRDE